VRNLLPGRPPDDREGHGSSDGPPGPGTRRRRAPAHPLQRGDPPVGEPLLGLPNRAPKRHRWQDKKRSGRACTTPGRQGIRSGT